MPEPLKRKTLDGTLYVRPPEIEAWIKKLETVDDVERLRQFAASVGHVPTEALIYFMRTAWKNGAHGEFEKIFRILMRRIGLSLCSAISDSSMVNARGIRDEIMGRFAERIAKDCKVRTALLDAFEVRFNMAFAAFRKSALRQIGGSVVDTVPLGEDGDHGLEISAEVEDAAADFLSGDPSILDDPAFRSELMAAINSLPDDQKKVIGLLIQGFQIDSKDESVMSIARILQCDERTVRNRRDRAYKTLKNILQKEIA